MAIIPNAEFLDQAKSFGRHVVSYLSNPIKDKPFLQRLSAEASSFRVGELSIPITIDEEKVFDLGGTQPNTSMVACVIDLENSNDLMHYVSRYLPYKLEEARPHYTAKVGDSELTGIFSNGKTSLTGPVKALSHSGYI